MRISDWSSDVCSSDLGNGTGDTNDGDGDGDGEQPSLELELEAALDPNAEPAEEAVERDEANAACGGGRQSAGGQIGRASCRESVCQDVSHQVVAHALQKN